MNTNAANTGFGYGSPNGCVVWDTAERTELQKALDRIERVSQVYSRYSSVITLRPVECMVVAQSSVPVFSTSKVIVFGANHLTDITDPKNAMALKGLTLHEVCHILFTPRNATTYRRIIAKEKLDKVFHIAEDARIETLLIGRFGTNITAWLNASVFRHLLSPGLDLSAQFVIVAGRTYLPLQIRQALRDVFALPEHADEIEMLLNEYRLMVFSNDDVVMRALEILRRLNELLGDLIDKSGTKGIPSPNGHEKRSNDEIESSTSRPLSIKEQEQAQKSASRQTPQNTNGTNQQAPNKPIDLPIDPTHKQGKGNEQGCLPMPSSSGGKTGNDKPENQNQENANGAGKEKAELTPALEKEISDLWEKDLSKVRNEVQKDIKAFRADLDLNDTNAKTPSKARYSNRTIDHKTLSAGRQFGIQLERIKSDLEPGWKYRQDEGKINANRYLTENDPERVFDEWQDGQEEATDIEAVILLDNSGSMSDNDKALKAYKSMFAIKMGLQAINAGCQVITYNEHAEMLYEPGDQVKGEIRDAGTGGGTDPKDALLYAQSVFANSKRRVKVLFTITDGEWGNSEQCDEIISVLSASGVLTAIAIIGNETNNRHESLISANIKNPTDLIGLAKSIVQFAIANALVK